MGSARREKEEGREKMMTIAARTTASTRIAKAPKASRGAKTTTVMRRAAFVTRPARSVASKAAADELVDGLQDKLSEVKTTLGEAWGNRTKSRPSSPSAC